MGDPKLATVGETYAKSCNGTDADAVTADIFNLSMRVLATTVRIELPSEK